MGIRCLMYSSVSSVYYYSSRHAYFCILSYDPPHHRLEPWVLLTSKCVKPRYSVKRQQQQYRLLLRCGGIMRPDIKTYYYCWLLLLLLLYPHKGLLPLATQKKNGSKVSGKNKKKRKKKHVGSLMIWSVFKSSRSLPSWRERECHDVAGGYNRQTEEYELKADV